MQLELLLRAALRVIASVAEVWQPQWRTLHDGNSATHACDDVAHACKNAGVVHAARDAALPLRHGTHTKKVKQITKINQEKTTRAPADSADLARPASPWPCCRAQERLGTTRRGAKGACSHFCDFRCKLSAKACACRWRLGWHAPGPPQSNGTLHLHTGWLVSRLLLGVSGMHTTQWCPIKDTELLEWGAQTPTSPQLTVMRTCSRSG